MARLGLKQLLSVLGFLVAFGVASGAQAQNAFGALALASDGAYGYSYNYGDIDAAQDLAIKECGKHARDCQIVRVFQNTCVVIVRDLNLKPPLVSWVSGYTADERSRRGLRNCRDGGGNSCEISGEFCTGKAK
jgi:hypothetical protein